MRILRRVVVLAAVALAGVAGFALSVRGASPPPTIDNLDGTKWLVTASGTESDLNGTSQKAGTQIEWTITKLDSDRVSLDTIFGGMINTARYRGGFLLQSYSSAESPPEDGSLLQLAVSGTPGKMKMKGQLTLFSAGSGYNVLRIQKITAKQIPNP